MTLNTIGLFKYNRPLISYSVHTSCSQFQRGESDRILKAKTLLLEKIIKNERYTPVNSYCHDYGGNQRLIIPSQKMEAERTY